MIIFDIIKDTIYITNKLKITIRVYQNKFGIEIQDEPGEITGKDNLVKIKKGK